MTSISATAAIAARPRCPAATARISGVDPRDAVVRFDIGVKGQSESRILPTNVVCVYAPRFAEVRVSTGTNENVDVQSDQHPQDDRQVHPVPNRGRPGGWSRTRPPSSRGLGRGPRA